MPKGMNLDKKQTEKGCIEYVDPDTRSMSVPVKIPPGFVMYRVCANGCCMNPQHMYFVDSDTAHLIEMSLRDVTLAFLRKYFKVDPKTLEPLEKPPLPTTNEPRIWLPTR
jgi:sugar lactone lactonase YvrE